MTNGTPDALAARVAVVTGATGGIGSAVCRRLAAAGARVAIAYRRDAAAAEVLRASLSGGGHAIFEADITSAASLARLADRIAEAYGTADILVNCAGYTRFVPHVDLDALDDALIDEIFRTNWRGPFATVRALRSLLASGAGGVVINVSSIAGINGHGSNVAYCASKAALNLMTVSLARALAPAIRVVSICPGLVDTDFIAGLDPAWRARQISRAPLGRLVQPEEVGDAVVAAVRLTGATGCVIPVDGGRLVD